MRQRPAEKPWEQLQADRDDEQRHKADRLDLSVRLGQLWPAQRDRQTQAAIDTSRSPVPSPGRIASANAMRSTAGMARDINGLRTGSSFLLISATSYRVWNSVALPRRSPP
jgi:hypothetical protein